MGCPEIISETDGSSDRGDRKLSLIHIYTTTSSAVASVLLRKDPEEVTGKGAGLTSEGLRRKIRVIREAIRMHEPEAQDVPDVLSKVGGLDIAGMTGLFLGGALYHVPVSYTHLDVYKRQP